LVAAFNNEDFRVMEQIVYENQRGKRRAGR
jgi:hypothetical protein